MSVDFSAMLNAKPDDHSDPSAYEVDEEVSQDPAAVALDTEAPSDYKTEDI